MADFPTLGLKFDLTEMSAGLQKLAQGKAAFDAVGNAAAESAQKTKAETSATRESGDVAAGAAEKRARASKKASSAEQESQRAIRDTINQLKILNDVARALQIEQTVRNRMKSIGAVQMVQAAAEVRDGGIKLVTEINNQAGQVQLAMSRLISPDALKGAERARMQAQLDQTFGAIEDTVDRNVLTLVTKIDRQAIRIKGAMANLIGPNALGAAARASRQAELDSVFNAIPLTVGSPMVPPRGGGGGGGGRGSGGGGGGSAGGMPEMGDNRSILAKTAALVGLGKVYDTVSAKGSGLLKNIGQLRVGFLNARFAAALFIGALTLGPLAAFADQMVALEARTRLYAKTGSDVPTIMADLYQTAQRARQPLEGIATLYTRLAPLADNLGRSQTQMLRVVETVAKAFTIGGAAASEATASAQQFAQALSSNRFGGDELRSVAENAPVLLAAIAEGVNKLGDEGFKGLDASLNLNAATFIKWAQAGNANAEVMVAALEKARGRIDAMFKTMPTTVSQGLAVLGNAFQKAIGDIDAAFGAMNGGQRLSTEIAQLIVQFSKFVESKAFIEGVATALTFIVDVLQGVGRAIEFVMNGMTPLLAGLATMLIVAKLAPLFSALAMSIRVYGLALTVTINAQAAAAAGAAMLRAAWTALVAASPLIILAAITAAFMVMSDAIAKGEQAVEGLTDNIQRAYDAIDRARLAASAYGNETEELTDLMLKAAGVEEERTAGLDDASKAALARAEMDKAMAIAAIASAKADLAAAQASAQRSIGFNNFVASVMGGLADLDRFFGNDELADMQDRIADRAKARVDAATAAIPQYQRAIEALGASQTLVEAMDFKPTAPADGSGVSTLTGDPSSDGAGGGRGANGMRGALKRIADLRAEMTAMQKEVAAAEVGFFGPGGMDALEGERAALEALANYGVQALDDISDAKLRATAATEMQLASENALKKIENDRIVGLIQTRRETDLQTVSLEHQSEAFFEVTNAMRSYYQDGARTIGGFSEAMRASSEAETQAAIVAEEHAIAAQFGVATIGELSGTLGDYARRLLEAREANIRLTRSQEEQRKSLDADLTREKEIAELTDYAASLMRGVRALQDFNREEQIRAAMEAAGPKANVISITADVDRLNAARLAASIAERANDAELATIDAALTGAERERGIRELILQYMLANKDATVEQARIAVNAATEEFDLRKKIAALIVSTSDDIRQTFIDAGRIDFTSLKENLARRIREAVYDSLLAQPIDMVVKATMEFTQKGLDAIMNYIKKALGGGEGDSMFDALGKFFGEGGKFGNFMGQFGETGNAIAGAMGQLSQMAPQLAAAYQANKMIVSGLGSIVGLSEQQQKNADKAASFGLGPIGALLYGMFGDTKRAMSLTALQVRDGRFTSAGTKSWDGGPQEEIDAAGIALANSLNKIVKAFGLSLRNVEGLYTVFGWTAGEKPKALGGEGFFGGLIRDLDSYRNLSLEEIKASALSKGFDVSQAKDAESAIDRILRETVIRIGEAQDVPFTEAEKALIRAAESLEEAAATLKTAREVEKDLGRALLQFTDPRAFALANLRDQQVERRQGIRDLVDQGLITADRIPGIEALLGQLESAEIRDALERFVNGVDGAAASLEQLQEAQAKIAEYAEALLVGKLSPLSPSAQLDLTSARFAQSLAAAQGGDLTALQNITGLAGEYLSAAQQFYGSGGQYGAIFDQVYQALTALSTQEFNDPLISALEEQMELLRLAIAAGFGNLIDVITGGGGGPLTPPPPTGGGGDDPVVGGGGGGGYGGGGSGGGDTQLYMRGMIDEMKETFQTGFESINEQLASHAEAVVASNNTGTQRVVEATVERSSAEALTRGGTTRQAA